VPKKKRNRNKRKRELENQTQEGVQANQYFIQNIPNVPIPFSSTKLMPQKTQNFETLAEAAYQRLSTPMEGYQNDTITNQKYQLVYQSSNILPSPNTQMETLQPKYIVLGHIEENNDSNKKINPEESTFDTNVETPESSNLTNEENLSKCYCELSGYTCPCQTKIFILKNKLKQLKEEMQHMRQYVNQFLSTIPQSTVSLINNNNNVNNILEVETKTTSKTTVDFLLN